MAKRLKVGTYVRIKESSEFYGQSYLVGCITLYESDTWMRVRFSDGYTNSYTANDLIITNTSGSRWGTKGNNDERTTTS